MQIKRGVRVLFFKREFLYIVYIYIYIIYMDIYGYLKGYFEGI